MKKLNKPYLNDIIDSINKIEDFVMGMDFEKFCDDDKTKDAVFRNIEVIGEASARLSNDFLEKNPKLNLYKAKGMRNRLIHEYDTINFKAVWSTVKNDLPKLKKQLEQIKKDLKE